jgi:lipopolysaccharide transport protein LptA
MRWQRIAQAAIAVFVIGFIAVLVVTLRRERAQPPPQEAPERIDETSTVETPKGGRQQVVDPSGRKEWELDFGTHIVLPDGRNRFSGGVKATVNRGEAPLVITAREADVTPPEEGDQVAPKEAVFRGDATITGSDGLEVKGNEITYTHADGLISMPGPVTFKKGRTTGSGVNATYDQNREVFWIRNQARVNVAPDPDGGGALEATADAIGMARLEHYMRLEGSARIDGQGRTANADSIVVRLTDDDQRVRALELRGNSRIAGSDGALQSMAARDIDMAYADDGRTLQTARLVESASVQLPGNGGGKQISGSTIDIGLGPDGTTVTSLVAAAPVQVDLPGEGNAPAKRICSSSLNATGEPHEGLRGATFSGGVEYRERRGSAITSPCAAGPAPARGQAAATDRTALSETLTVETQPGLGAIQRADFRGNVRFTDPPDFVAQAQQGIYDIARDRLDLSPSPGLPGPQSPTVTDGNVTVAARTIQFSLASGGLIAETTVRSTIDPRNRKKESTAKVPSMLADDEPVNVTSNRLEYKGEGSAAVYTGAATLWQGADTTIKADSIAIDEKTGNLIARGKATTSFLFEEADRKTGQKRRQSTTGTADTFAYDDNKRIATYTGKARMTGPQGDVTGEEILLYLKPDVNELERAEAAGANGAVTVRESNRKSEGDHLVYTSADERYVMTGNPVKITQERNGNCTLTIGSSATFNRASESAEVLGSASGRIPARTEAMKACPPELRR